MSLQTLALSDPNNCCLHYPQGGRRRWTTWGAPTLSTTTTELHSGNGLPTCMLGHFKARVWFEKQNKLTSSSNKCLNYVFSHSDVISETESDNQQRQIHQEAHRVFRSRRHISEDLENEHMEPRDLDTVRENNIYVILQWATVKQHSSHSCFPFILL